VSPVPGGAYLTSLPQHPFRRCNAFTQLIECIHQVRLHPRLLGVQGGAGAFAHHISFSVAQPDKDAGAFNIALTMRGSDMDSTATSIGDF